jgi:hypothetical protein
MVSYIRGKYRTYERLFPMPGRKEIFLIKDADALECWFIVY